eukprot:CAMPEP_0180120850 /NCGR_PEP_ID=MMETSP0986-20121125/2741_1 /TAXON_ID=697907 /ORGANISM="non described non described, Strain CCMP2293" /LENGTH=424 /DNA_ID=CAMNT_0022059957 /DNA_START=135 /DNA_END=1406 /DNA_ORIENTATION=-
MYSRDTFRPIKSRGSNVIPRRARPSLGPPPPPNPKLDTWLLKPSSQGALHNQREGCTLHRSPQPRGHATWLLPPCIVVLPGFVVPVVGEPSRFNPPQLPPVEEDLALLEELSSPFVDQHQLDVVLDREPPRVRIRWRDIHPLEGPAERHPLGAPRDAIHHLGLGDDLVVHQFWQAWLPWFRHLDADDGRLHRHQMQPHNRESDASGEDGAHRIVAALVHERYVQAVLYADLHLDGRVLVRLWQILLQQLHHHLLLESGVADESSKHRHPHYVPEAHVPPVVGLVRLFYHAEVEIELVRSLLQLPRRSHVSREVKEFCAVRVRKLRVFDTLDESQEQHLDATVLDDAPGLDHNLDRTRDGVLARQESAWPRRSFHVASICRLMLARTRNLDVPGMSELVLDSIRNSIQKLPSQRQHPPAAPATSR